nr:PIN domain-containing protein [Deinococcus humi]
MDANVLYPAVLRSYLIDLSLLGVYQAHWTDELQDEWIRNLQLNRSELDEARLRQTQGLMDRALPEARITGHEPLIRTLTLPDADDRHVLAAAIHGQVDVIVTQNLRDFPSAVLDASSLRAVSPDDFLGGFLPDQAAALVEALRAQQARYRAPPLTMADLLHRLAQQGVPTVANSLASLLKISRPAL